MSQSPQSVYMNTVSASNTWTTEDSKFQRLSICNPSSSSGTVTITGGGTKNGNTGNGVVLQAGQSLTISVTSDISYLTGISVTTASGTTAQIIGQ